MKRNKRILFIVFVGLILIIIINIVYTSNSFSIILIDYKQNIEEISDYRDFINKTQKYQSKVSDTLFWEQIYSASEFMNNNPKGKKSSNLRETIIEKLNIGFFLNNTNSKQLKVYTNSEISHNKYFEKELTFQDPYAGNLSALLLIPKQESNSAIIALHGHGQNMYDAKEFFFGERLAEEGFIVLMPSFRAMDCEYDEYTITKELYRNNLTLMGIRIYETNLLKNYLENQHYVEKIGIIGHSGGSIVGVLYSHIHNLDALAYDCKSDFLNTCPNDLIHCETIPGLAYYAPQVFNPDNIIVSSTFFNYGKFKEDELLSFFNRELNNK